MTNGTVPPTQLV